MTILKKTKSWQYVTNEKELEEIKESHSIVGKILEYRKLNSILSERTKKKTAIKQMPDLFGFIQEQDDEKIHQNSLTLRFQNK